MKTAFPTLLLLLLVVVLPNFAHAAMTCEDVFTDIPARLHEAHYKKFVQEDAPFRDRLQNIAAIKVQLGRLAQALPAGMYEVTINDIKKDVMLVSYDKAMNVTIRLASRPLLQSESVPLSRSGRTPSTGSLSTIVRNMTFGIDAAIRLSQNGIELRTSTVRGNEKMLTGLNRSDLRTQLNSATGPIQSIVITEQNSNWSVYRQDDVTQTTETRIVIVKRI